MGFTFKLFPTICFRTRYSSPLDMKPSRSISYTLNATVSGREQEGYRGRDREWGLRCRVWYRCSKGRSISALHDIQSNDNYSHLNFSSLPPLLLNALNPPTNSWKSTVPLPLKDISSASVSVQLDPRVAPAVAEVKLTLHRI